MKKKLLGFALVSMMALVLGACGGSKDSGAAAPAAGGGEAAKPEASSEAWAPKENIEMIVAYKAGSGTDNTSRVLTKYANKYIGQTVVINNLEGGSGSIGWTSLANAKPDGYTLGFVNLPTLMSNIVDDLGDYEVDSFIPICNHVTETSVVLVAADSKYNTIQELVDDAKANPDTLKASTNGSKASNHIGAQLFASTAGFTYSDIPYGGTADQLLALRQHEVDFSVAKLADFASFASEVKVLGVFDTKRLEEYPDVPTLGECGYYDQWYGSARAIVAPKGTPQNIIDFYADAFKKMMEDPEYLADAEKASVTTNYMGPEDTAALFQAQYDFCTNTVAGLWTE